MVLAAESVFAPNVNLDKGLKARPEGSIVNFPPSSPFDKYIGITPQEWRRLVIQDQTMGIPLEDEEEIFTM